MGGLSAWPSSWALTSADNLGNYTPSSHTPHLFTVHSSKFSSLPIDLHRRRRCSILKINLFFLCISGHDSTKPRKRCTQQTRLAFRGTPPRFAKKGAAGGCSIVDDNQCLNNLHRRRTVLLSQRLTLNRRS